MTQRDEHSAGEPADSATASPATAPMAESSPWAPLRQRAFRWLWLGVLISYVGTWMQTVGAQWLVVDGPNAATMVALVQAANTLPVMLLALPGEFWPTPSTGAGCCSPFRLTSSSLASSSGAHHRGTDAAGSAAGVHVCPGRRCGRATAGVADRHPRVGAEDPTGRGNQAGNGEVNFARSVGPALAGLVIAWSGVPAVFALNALS